MTDKELLNDWLLSLYSGLKNIKKEIRDLEINMDYTKELSELQSSRINSWLVREDIEPDIKQELEHSKDAVDRFLKKDMDRLDQLKQDKKSVIFMIDNIEEELRG